MAIKLTQITDGLDDASLIAAGSLPNSWSDDSTLSAITGNISNYWRLSNDSTTQTPVVGSVNMTLQGASTGIVPARAGLGPDSRNPALWCQDHQDYYLITDSAIGPSGDFSVWFWYFVTQTGNTLNFMIDWDRDPAVDSVRRTFMVYQQNTFRIQSARLTSAEMVDPTDSGTTAMGRQPTFSWDLVVWTYDSSAEVNYGFYNGSYHGSYALSALDLSTSPLALNRLRDSAAGGTRSYMAHCGYMDGYAMSPNEVKALWNNGTGRFL